MARVKHPHLGALILAGGLGSRMGYQNKGLVQFGDIHLIDPVLSVLQQHCGYVAISANQDIEQYLHKNVDVWKDQDPWVGMGPLAGVVSSVPYFPNHIEYIQVVPCDSPFVNLNVITALSEKIHSTQKKAVYACTSTQIYPVIFQFKRTALLQLSKYLMASNKHSIRGWLKEVDAFAVHFEDDSAFINMNDMNTLNKHVMARGMKCH